MCIHPLAVVKLDCRLFTAEFTVLFSIC